MSAPSALSGGDPSIIQNKYGSPPPSNPVPVPAAVEKARAAGDVLNSSPSSLSSSPKPVHPSVAPAASTQTQKTANGILSSSPTQSQSSSPPKKPLNLLKPEGVQDTLRTFREFISLVERTTAGLSKPRSYPKMKNPENEKYVNSFQVSDEKAVEEKNLMMGKLAAGHMKRLTNFQTYLRGLIDEINSREIIKELKEIEDHLTGRNIQRKEEEGKSSTTSSFTSASLLSGFCPALKEGWEKLLEIEELNSQLKSLEKKFNFIGNVPADFEKEFRAAEVGKFKARLGKCSLTYQQAAKLDGWENEELTKVRKLADERFKVLQKQVDISPLEIKTSTSTSCPDLDKIEKDFKDFIVFDPVENIKILYQNVLRLKMLVATEAAFEVYRKDRSGFHMQRFKEWERLKNLMELFVIGLTIETLKTLMETAKANGEDIQSLHEEIKRAFSTYEGKKKNQIKE